MARDPRNLRLRRLRRLLLGLAVLSSLAGLLLTRVVREPLLGALAPRLLARLPGGGPAWGVLRWPRLGRLELEDLLWVAGTDTLVAARFVAVDVELSGLPRGDLRLAELTVLDLSLDLAALRRHLPAGSEEDRPRSWPKEGSLPGWPSVACTHLRVEGSGLRLDSLRRVGSWGLHGRLEAGRRHEPWLDVDSLWLELDEPSLALRMGRSAWRPARGRLDGRLSAVLPTGRLDLQVRSTGTDRHRLVVSHGPSVAVLDGVVGRKGVVWESLAWTGTLALDSLGPALPRWGHPALPAALRGPLELDLAWRPAARLGLRWQGRSDSPGTFALAASATAAGLVLDSLGLSGAGWWLAGGGVLEEGRLRASLQGVLEPLSPSSATSGPLPAGVGARWELTAEGAPPFPDLTVDATLFRQEVEVRLAARSRGDSLLLLDRLDVVEAGRAQAPPRPAGRLARQGPDAWRLDGLRLEGLAGSWRLDGRLEGGTARFTLDGNLPSLAPPLALALGLSDSLGRGLDQALRAGAPPRLRAVGSLHLREGGWDLEASPDLLLPGPARWSRFLPADLRLDGLGDVALRGRTALTMGPGGLGGSLRLAGRGAGWLDTLALDLSAKGRRLSLDSLWLAAPQADLRASGRWDGKRVELGADLDLEGLALLHRVLPGWEESGARLAGRLRLDGPASHPGWELALDGQVRHGAVELPQLRLELARGEDGPATRLNLVAQAPGQSLAAALQATPDKGWRVEGTLDYQRDGGTLATTRPFHLRLPRGGGLELDSLALAGSLGSLAGRIHLTPDSLSRRVELRGAAPLDPWLGRPAGGPSWGRLEVAAQAGPAELDLGLRLTGLDSAWGPLWADLALRGALANPALAATIRQAGDTLARAAGRLPARLSLWPPALVPTRDELDLDLVLDGLPLPDPSPGLRLHGQARLDGPPARPRLEAELEARPREGSRLAGYLAQAHVSLAGEDSLGRVEADLDLRRQGRPLARGHAALDLLRSPSTPPWAWTAGPLRATLRADSLALEELDPLMPADVWLSGRTSLALEVDGRLPDPRLGGQVRVEEFALRRGDGTRLFGVAGLDLDGRLRRPVVRGKVELRNGEVRLPELPRGLHATRGSSLLWEMAGGPAASNQASAAGSPLLDSLDLEVEILLPERLRLRGGDLDLEGRGQVLVRQAQGAARLQGDLEVVSGRFRLLGRSFEVRSGSLAWYGDEVLAPELDLELATRVEDTEVTLRLTGNLERPLLSMTSEPALEEGEIMALLLFRRPGRELDGQQQDLLQRQATRLAADFGMEALQDRVSRHLGLDQLRLDTSGEEGPGTLLLGKYLGPRVLVRYEQSLSQQDLYQLNVEYVLSRHLRLDTVTGGRGRSGLSLAWRRTW